MQGRDFGDSKAAVKGRISCLTVELEDFDENIFIIQGQFVKV